ncbi:MAG: serine hydrolase [Candidatus Glassbacteria bacterium]
MARTTHSGFMIQSLFGNKMNFEIVLPDILGNGLVHCWRDNDGGREWIGPSRFAQGIRVDGVPCLIQSTFDDPGNLEVVARVGARLAHFWRHSGTLLWSGPTYFATSCAQSPAFIQSRFGNRGNFEVVVPLSPKGVAHYWRKNDQPGASWQFSTKFATNLTVDAVSLIQSNYGTPGNLEVVLRAGDKLYHFYRDAGGWKAGAQFFSGAAGKPCFIQSRYGTQGNFEVVTPLAAGGLAHLYRNNDAGGAWQQSTSFAAAEGQFEAVALIQSFYGTYTLGNLEVAAWDGRSAAMFWRQDVAPFGWTGPTKQVGFVTGRHVPKLKALDDLMLQAMADRGVKNATMAIMRNGNIVLEHGYGWMAPPPNSLMRIASVSKMLTRSAIGVLYRRGTLTATTKVFPLLNLTPLPGQTPENRLNKITVDHLIEHKAGWDISLLADDQVLGERTGPQSVGFDPAFGSREISLEMGLTGMPTAWDVGRYMLGRPLQYDPGSPPNPASPPYANIGYIYLSLVVERVSGKRFIDFVREDVLGPHGIQDVFLARSLLALRHPREVRYSDPWRTPTALDPDSQVRVDGPDGGWSLEAMEGAGGLIASAAALVEYMQHYWLFSTEERDSRVFIWRAVGSEPGTHAEAVQRAGNINYAILFNTRTVTAGLNIGDIAPLIDNAISGITNWP